MFCNSEIENFTLNLHLQQLPPSSQVYPSKRPCLPPPGPSQATQHPTRPGRRRNPPGWRNSPRCPWTTRPPISCDPLVYIGKAQGTPPPHPFGSPSAAVPHTSLAGMHCTNCTNPACIVQQCAQCAAQKIFSLH